MGKDNLPEIIIKYKGIFDFDELFNVIYDWLVHQKFDVDESKYKHKIPTPKGAEQEIGWKATKNVTHYIKYNIGIDYKLWDLKDVEVVKANEKKQLAFAKLRILINSSIEFDYGNQFGGSNFKEKLGSFFNKYIYKEDINIIYGDQLYYRVYKLQHVIKKFLDMEAKTNAFEGRW